MNWTLAALECFERNSQCRGCYFSQLSFGCQMFKAVNRLVKTHGEPTDEDWKRILSENKRIKSSLYPVKSVDEQLSKDQILEFIRKNLVASCLEIAKSLNYPVTYTKSQLDQLITENRIRKTGVYKNTKYIRVMD